MELDPDLPWIFEGKQYDYRFRQQGGGSMRGDVLYVALAPGWTAEHAENTGPLPGTNRNVFRMVTSGRLTKGSLAFSVRVSSLSEDASCDWSRDNRFWGVEMLQPSLAFCGKPKVILSIQDTKKTPRGEMLWKTPMMENFSPFPHLQHRPASRTCGSRLPVVPACAAACCSCQPGLLSVFLPAKTGAVSSVLNTGRPPGHPLPHRSRRWNLNAIPMETISILF